MCLLLTCGINIVDGKNKKIDKKKEWNQYKITFFGQHLNKYKNKAFCIDHKLFCRLA